MVWYLTVFTRSAGVSARSEAWWFVDYWLYGLHFQRIWCFMWQAHWRTFDHPQNSNRQVFAMLIQIMTQPDSMYQRYMTKMTVSWLIGTSFVESRSILRVFHASPCCLGSNSSKFCLFKNSDGQLRTQLHPQCHPGPKHPYNCHNMTIHQLHTTIMF